MTSGGKRKPAKADRFAEQGEGGGFSYQQSRCQDAVAADATVRHERPHGHVVEGRDSTAEQTTYDYVRDADGNVYIDRRDEE